MKKLALFMLSIICCLSVFTFVGCKKDDNVIKVNEVTHSIFYAPLYVAMNNGYFEDEGYKVELTNGNGSNVSMQALLTGGADIILAGPETACYVVAEGKKDYPVIFGQLTNKDGCFIIGREAKSDFTLADLVGKEVIIGRKGGMPAMMFEYIVKTAGYEIGTEADQINLNTSIDFGNMVAAFSGNGQTAGVGDYCTMFEPTASNFVAAGKGYRISSVSALAPDTPYTCFMTSKSFLSENDKKCEAFLKAIKKALDYINTASLDNVALSLQPSFSGTSINDIKSAVENYKLINAWKENLQLGEEGFNSLISIIRMAGTLEGTVSYSKVVDNTIAKRLEPATAA